ncbi:hypothetical protein TWF730_000109 [Orbilia blumenaviensis]|uniref:BZIP domain-containing protein n=1 Tax=Orbilia blumenaviensis TaxID=1796055 RepID=A0AAV9VRP8_9PEZI
MSNPAGEIMATTAASQPRKRRKLTEKRRAQNREAQRLFRERKRKKVFEALQQSTDPEYWNNQANSSTDDPSGPGNISVGLSASSSSTGPGARFEIPTRISKEDAINEAAKHLYNLDVDYAREKQAGRSSSAPRLISLHWLLNDPHDPTPASDTIPNPYDGTAASNQYTSDDAGSRPMLQGPLDFDNGESSSQPVDPPTITIEEASLGTPLDSGDDVTEIQRSSSVTQPEPFFTPASVGQAIEGYTLRDIIEAGLEALASKEHQLDTRLSRSQKTWNREWEATIDDISQKALEEMLVYTPSPCKTHINLHEITTFKAVVVNAKAIGFWSPIPDDFKDPYKSPFVQAYFMNNQSVEKVQQKFADIAEPLQPSALQCMTPHKAYIDVFPFPDFRERVIKAASGGLINELEFCADLGKSALMCWGNGHGKYGGEPWNPRSWEAQPWFIEKWDALIDDELKECSKFWRNLRDEGREAVDGEGSSFTPTIQLS